MIQQKHKEKNNSNQNSWVVTNFIYFLYEF